MGRIIVSLWLGLSVGSVCHALQLSESEFASLHDQLNPKDEVWQTIPWRTSLVKAQQDAAVQEKPIFIWTMDGHPLGCT